MPLGGSVPFAWELSGAAHRVTGLTIALRGGEEARYSQGTDMQTDTLGVVQTMALAAPRPEDQRDFTLPLPLPREPYSFSGTLISLVWAIELIIEPGAHVERREFVLSATGREVVLGREGA